MMEVKPTPGSENTSVGDLHIAINRDSDHSQPKSSSLQLKRDLSVETKADTPLRTKLSVLGLSLPDYMKSTYVVSPQEVLHQQHNRDDIICPNCNSQITALNSPCQCTYSSTNPASFPRSPRRAAEEQQLDVRGNAFSNLPGTHGYRRALHRRLHNIMIHPCLTWFCVLLLMLQIALLAVTIYRVAKRQEEPLWLIVWDSIVLWLFLLELSLRVAGLRSDFFKGPWSVAELGLAGVSLLLWIIDIATDTNDDNFLWVSLLVTVLAHSVRTAVMCVSMRRRFKVLRAEGLRVTLDGNLAAAPPLAQSLSVRGAAAGLGVAACGVRVWDEGVRAGAGGAAVEMAELGQRDEATDTSNARSPIASAAPAATAEPLATATASVEVGAAPRDSLGKPAGADTGAGTGAMSSELVDDLPHPAMFALTMPSERDSQEFPPSVFSEVSPTTLEAGLGPRDSTDLTLPLPPVPSSAAHAGADDALAADETDVVAALPERARTLPPDDALGHPSLSTLSGASSLSARGLSSPQLGRAGSAFFPHRHVSVDSRAPSTGPESREHRSSDATARTRTAINALLAGATSPLVDEDDGADAIAMGGVGEFDADAERERTRVRSRARSQAYAGFSGSGYAHGQLEPAVSERGRPPLGMLPVPALGNARSGTSLAAVAGAPVPGAVGDASMPSLQRYATDARTDSASVLGSLHSSLTNAFSHTQPSAGHALSSLSASSAGPPLSPTTAVPGLSIVRGEERDGRVGFGLRKVGSNNTIATAMLSRIGSERELDEALQRQDADTRGYSPPRSVASGHDELPPEGFGVTPLSGLTLLAADAQQVGGTRPLLDAWDYGIASAADDGGDSIGNGSSDVDVDMGSVNDDVYADELYEQDAF